MNPNSDDTLFGVFAARAASSPQQIALRIQSTEVRFDELAEVAGRMAVELAERGVGHGDRVALCMSRSPQTVAAMLGALKLGAAFVPIDPFYPRDRIELMLTDSRARVIVTQDHLADGLPAIDVPRLVVEPRLPPRATGSATAPAPSAGNGASGTSPDDVAYVIYTSGSTGRPKGVMGTHRATLRRFEWMWKTFPFRDDDVCCHKTSLSFVDSIWETLGPLLAGVPAVVIPEQAVIDFERLFRILSRDQVSWIVLVPSLLNAMLAAEPNLRARLPRLHQWITSGEAIRLELVREFQRRMTGCRLLNLYGSSEVAADVTFHDLTELPAARTSVPIGRAITGSRVLVLGDDWTPVPRGTTGEIFVAGDALARGYLGRPDLTAERFLPDPSGGGGRMYRTGDLGHEAHDGELEFDGRADYQVKIRGFRVELGEIERRLQHHPSVKAAIVVVREEQPGNPRLIAYVVHGGPEASVDEMRAHVAAALPDYMVPTDVMWLEAFPLTPNGKIDRNALPTRAIATSKADLDTPTERLLGRVWAELLQLPSVGRDDRFSALGGNSLDAVGALSALSGELGIEIPLALLISGDHLFEIAAAIDQLRASVPGDVESESKDFVEGRFPASHVQQRMWLAEAIGTQNSNFEVMHVRGPLDVALLERAFCDLVARHKGLRTTLHQDGERLVQVIAPRPAPTLDLVDVCSLPSDERGQRVTEILRIEAKRHLDTSSWPAFAMLVIRESADHHILVLSLPHSLVDGWSFGLLLRDLSDSYAAHLTGRASALPEIRGEYVDYAQREHDLLAGPARAERLAYWRDHMRGVPAALELPIARARPPVASYRGGILPVHIGPHLATAIADLARTHATTAFCVAMAAFHTLLHRYTGEDRIVVGTPIDNRDSSLFLDTIGCFMDVLPLSTRVGDDPSFLTVMDRVSSALRDGRRNALPFDVLVQELSPARRPGADPFFQMMLNLDNIDGMPMTIPHARVEREHFDPGSGALDLTIALSQGQHEIGGLLEYSSDLFDRDVAQQFLNQYVVLLEAVVADPSARIENIVLDGGADPAIG